MNYNQERRKMSAFELKRLEVRKRYYKGLLDDNLWYIILSLASLAGLIFKYFLTTSIGLLGSILIVLSAFLAFRYWPFVKMLRTYDADIEDQNVIAANLYVDVIHDLPFKKAKGNPAEEDGQIFFMKNPFDFEEFLYDTGTEPEYGKAKEIRVTFAENSKFVFSAEILN
ncbi:MAG: hypothetical protein AB8B53_00230 [Flavobacteriales bacterium]